MLSKLGGGAQGSVHLVEDKYTKELCVVKKVQLSMAIEYFGREKESHGIRLVELRKDPLRKGDI